MPQCRIESAAEPVGYGMEIAAVGVVGAGQMGTGIAHVFALAGYAVLMTDISADMLAKAVPQIGDRKSVV